MSSDITQIGAHKVKSVSNGEVVELKTFWENQNVAIIFFRRWGCMLCRLWAKELSEIAPVLQKNNVKLIGVGVEELGSEEFVKKKFFDGDLYYVEDITTYHQLGFKRFNVVSILTSLFWKQSRDAIFKGRGMGIEIDTVGDGLQNGGVIIVKNGKLTLNFVQVGPADHLSNTNILEFGVSQSLSAKNRTLRQAVIASLFYFCDLGGDRKGDWVQTGGAILVQRGGNLLRHFVQTGPADHMPNLDILKKYSALSHNLIHSPYFSSTDSNGIFIQAFGLEHEYIPETMTNKSREDAKCTPESKP